MTARKEASPAAQTWRPTATRAALEQRAALLARARRFFFDRGVLEVDTPVVVNAAVTDIHIHSARVHFAGHANDYFLHTSPEYAMKRLLAAGSGDIYQICHVVRGLERGRQHNTEFTLIEWYRIGFSLDDLMSEVDALVRDLLGERSAALSSERLSYRGVFLRELQLDPFTASLAQLRDAAEALGFKAGPATCAADRPENSTTPTGADGDAATARDELLDLLMGAIIGPRLGQHALTFVHGYPASQAALARLDPKDPRVASRFELYGKGMELANGFHELASAAEQRARFLHDHEERSRRGLPSFGIDERLLEALESGLPDCAGVALGFDRTVMLASGAGHIDAVLPFPTERA
jgi:lysyl-tRNA synthetase class 2